MGPTLTQSAAWKSVVCVYSCSLFLNNVKSKQQVQLQGYFNPQAAPKRIMGVLYLPRTVGSQHPLPISLDAKPFKTVSLSLSCLGFTGFHHVCVCCVCHRRPISNISLSLSLSASLIQGARVNAKDNKWLTPLHRAVASCSEVMHYTNTRAANAYCGDSTVIM